MVVQSRVRLHALFRCIIPGAIYIGSGSSDTVNFLQEGGTDTLTELVHKGGEKSADLQGHA